MKFLIIIGTLVCAAQTKPDVCEIGNPSGKCASKQPFCQKGYECVDGNCCQAKERLCPHNQRSHGLCDDIGQCPDPGHQCITTDDDQSVCCNKNQPTPKQRDCLTGKPCESSDDCQKSYGCVDEGICCKISSDSASCPTNYSNNPLLGCYIILRESNLISHNYAKERCSDDGGALLLLNSKEETDEVIKLMIEGRFSHIAIQGSRSSVNSEWITDDGSPLPYFPTSVNNAQNALNTALVLHAYPGFRLDAVNPEVNRMTCFACEIES